MRSLSCKQVGIEREPRQEARTRFLPKTSQEEEIPRGLSRPTCRSDSHSGGVEGL